MKKRPQAGFMIVELVIGVVVLAGLVTAGYFVWHQHKMQTASSSSLSVGGYQSPPTTTPVAPQINNASELNNAMSALNQTKVSSSSTDSAQLSTDSSAF